VANLSIFGRTFLLMIAALVIAEGIGIALLISRPPLHNAPVALSRIAQMLESGSDSSRSKPLPPLSSDQFQTRDGPPGPPPDHLDERGGPPPPPHQFDGRNGPPRPPGEFGPRDGGPPDRSKGRRDELVIWYSAVPPVPPEGVDELASKDLRQRLAALLGVDESTVAIYAGRDDARRLAQPAPGGDLTLREGFLAARSLPQGGWRIVESVVEGFPNAFQRQALLLFGVGLLALLPLAWVFARALAAPIRRFSQAARMLGADPQAQPLPMQGPAEMLLAVESFNEMQARLNRLLQERTQMMGAIAHDLRTPLTRLAFRLSDLPAPLSDKVNADIQEMKSMIAAVLDFIRDRALSNRRERLDFRLLVESVVDDQSDLGRDVTLEGGAPLTVLGDPLALRRAVGNLVDNAVKYGERARLRLRVSDSRCTLEIDDDGPGIPQSQLQRVFEPFFRLEHSRNRDTGGVGLGLAVVRATITDHGGDVVLSACSGGGLRATLWLPLAGR